MNNSHLAFSTEDWLDNANLRNAERSLLQQAEFTISQLKNFLPHERETFFKAVIAVRSEKPLTAVVNGKPVMDRQELLRRVAKLIDHTSNATAAQHQGTGERTNQRGWAPLRMPTAGSRSGTQAHSL